MTSSQREITSDLLDKCSPQGRHHIPSAVRSPDHRQGHDLRPGLPPASRSGQCSPVGGYRHRACPTTDPAAPIRPGVRATGTSSAQAVLDAGWDERALHDAVAVCALFNFMNRFVDGLGVTAGPDYTAVSSRRLADIAYAGLRDLL